MWNSEVQLSIIYGSTFYCHKIPKNCDKKKCSKKYKKCTRKKDGKVFDLPRLYSREACKKMKKKGFTQKSSCAAYN